MIIPLEHVEMTSKQDYLKKYLSGGGGGKDKKKRRKVEKKKKTVVFLDGDADWKKSVQSSDDSESDTPIIVGEDTTFTICAV